jgi:hypothetical protein
MRHFKKDFISFSKLKKHEEWNGRSSLLFGEVGRIEGFKLYKSGVSD